MGRFAKTYSDSVLHVVLRLNRSTGPSLARTIIWASVGIPTREADGGEVKRGNLSQTMLYYTHQIPFSLLEGHCSYSGAEALFHKISQYWYQAAKISSWLNACRPKQSDFVQSMKKTWTQTICPTSYGSYLKSRSRSWPGLGLCWRPKKQIAAEKLSKQQTGLLCWLGRGRKWQLFKPNF